MIGRGAEALGAWQPSSDEGAEMVENGMAAICRRPLARADGRAGNDPGRSPRIHRMQLEMRRGEFMKLIGAITSHMFAGSASSWRRRSWTTTSSEEDNADIGATVTINHRASALPP